MNSAYFEINLENFKHNLNTIKNYAKKDIIPVVKANAYGHGMIEIAKLCRNNGIGLIAVAFLSEANLLRNSGDTGEILLLVENPLDNISHIVDLNLQSVLSDYDFAYKLNSEAKWKNTKVKCHIFLDTGMHRDGIDCEEAKEFISKVSELNNLEVIGLMTHFSSSEDADYTFTQSQIERFKKQVDELKLEHLSYIHLQNSGGLIQFNIEFANFVRPGISIYGLVPDERLKNSIDLKPILQLKAKIIRIKELEQNEQAGYSFKFIAKRKSRIAFIPIGYGDGINTNLTNNWQVEINKLLYPLVGSICMDQILIDITDNPDIKIGDDVLVISNDIESEINVYKMAEKANVIPYDIITKLLPRLPRIYV